MMEKFIERSGLCFSAENIEGTAPFYIELKQFECDNQLLEDWPDFIDDLHNDPTTVLNCLSLAVHQVCKNTIEKSIENLYFSNSLKIIIANSFVSDYLRAIYQGRKKFNWGEPNHQSENSKLSSNCAFEGFENANVW